MKLLPIFGGLFSSVDNEDFDRLSEFKWHLSKRKGGFFYVVRTQRIDPKTSIKFYLHREVMRATKSQKVDHKDRNVLNNQKSNLRFCTQSQNMANRRPSVNHKNKFKGVSKSGDRWFSKVKKNGKTMSLGGYASEQEAAIAYNKAAKGLWGDFAFLNDVASRT